MVYKERYSWMLTPELNLIISQPPVCLHLKIFFYTGPWLRYIKTFLSILASFYTLKRNAITYGGGYTLDIGFLAMLPGWLTYSLGLPRCSLWANPTNLSRALLPLPIFQTIGMFFRQNQHVQGLYFGLLSCIKGHGTPRCLQIGVMRPSAHQCLGLCCLLFVRKLTIFSSVQHPQTYVSLEASLTWLVEPNTKAAS